MTTTLQLPGTCDMQGLDERALEEVAHFFAAFAVPMRLKILNALRGGERNVSELTHALGGSQANVSKHLAVLAQKKLIAKATRGTSAYYRIVDPRIYQLCDLVCMQIGDRLALQDGLKDAFRRTPPRTQGKGRRAATR